MTDYSALVKQRGMSTQQTHIELNTDTGIDFIEIDFQIAPTHHS